jgi:hypothetical protein
MNWFERYGIPGAYFVLLLATLSVICWADSLVQYFECHPQLLTGVAALGAAASIPIGYLLAIISQVLYYTPLSWFWKVHRPAWKWAWNNRSDRERKPNERKPRHASEWHVEADVTFVARWKHHYKGEDGLKRSEFMQQWFAKRSDVMAMNAAMIWGTVVAVGLLISAWGTGFFPYPQGWHAPYLLWLYAAAAIGLILFVDNIILSHQARRILRNYMRDFVGAGLKMYQFRRFENAANSPV